MSLRRELGMLDVFCIVSGAMVSSGLYILPGLAYARTGPSVFLAYLLAGVVAVPALLSKAELATAMPKAGGTYYYIDRSMGAAMGTLGGLAAWFSLSFKSAFALVGMGAFTALFFPSLTGFQLKLVAAGFCVFFTLVNLRGASHAGRFQVIFVLCLLLILVAYVAAGASSVREARFIPFTTAGFSGLLATAGLVFVSYGGLTKVASIAEEVRDPGRNIPLGMFLSFLVVTTLYVLVTIVTVGVVGSPELATTLTPINLGAKALFGPVGVTCVALAAVLAFVSTANAGILASSRVPLAMSRDQLLPSLFNKVDEKRATPYLAILVTSAFMIAVILFLDLEGLVKTASTLKLVLFILVNLSVIIMRESRLENYRPRFHSPLYPWVQVGGIFSYGILIAVMGLIPILLSCGFLVLSLVWYWIYARHTTNKRESALIRLVKRIAGRDLDCRGLSQELKEILCERDQIQEDRFDRLVKACEIVDLPSATDLHEFCFQAASYLAPATELSTTEFRDLLIQREEDTSTALTPHLAVPHVVLPGEGQFMLLLARCSKGINFSAKSPDIQAVFVLAGTEDERNFHLRALMAIAQIAQQPDFEKKWLAAHHREDLRDLLLLATRRRHDD